MNEIQKLYEAIRSSDAIKQTGVEVTCFWDEPPGNKPTGAWFLDIILDNGKPGAKHLVVEWRGWQPDAGFGMTCLGPHTTPFGGTGHVARDVSEGVAWVLQQCDRMK